MNWEFYVFGLEGMQFEAEQFTCYGCCWGSFIKNTPFECEFEFDLYNTNGDCLYVK